MEKQNHPSKEILITVKEYIIEFGNKPLGLKILDPNATALFVLKFYLRKMLIQCHPLIAIFLITQKANSAP